MGDLLTTSRPAYHFIAPQGWMNDPCAPGYDPKTETFHLFYQWNPRSHAWGDISWGHATSTDLLRWTHASRDKPVLVPDHDYDRGGVWTGCLVRSDPHGPKDALTVFYTSVSSLPVHFSIPHVRGSETLAMAVSKDSGKTWTKSDTNPVLTGEPPSLEVTGFRDPFVFSWPIHPPGSTSGAQPKQQLYGLLSGGTRGQDAGPRLFLYTIDPTDLTRWTFERTLLTDLKPGQGITGTDVGVNFECASVVQLRTLGPGNATIRTVMLAGAEGVRDRHVHPNPSAPHGPPRSAVWLWLDNDALALPARHARGGLLDAGILYAAAPFTHPDGRTLLWGWLPEDDIPDAALAKQGYSGCFGVLRELFLARYRGVVSTSIPDLLGLGFQVEKGDGDATTATVHTLGIRPAAELASLRGPHECRILGASAAVPWPLLHSCPAACEVEAEFELTPSCTEVAVVVRHNDDLSIGTRIVVRPQEREIRVIRAHSTHSSDVNTRDEFGPFTLLSYKGDSPDKPVVLEPLTLRIFLDGEVLEVFANDRFALSTRIYPPSEGCEGISLDWKGDHTLRLADHTREGAFWDNNAKLKSVYIWEMTGVSE